MDKPPARPSASPTPGRAEPPVQKQLFSTLLASKPQREKRGVWIVVAFAHLVVFTILWFTDPARRLRDRVFEIVTPIMVSDEEPIIVPLSDPAPPAEPEEREAQPVRPAAPPVAEPRGRTPATDAPITSPISSDPLITPTTIPTNIPPGTGGGGSLRERLMGGPPNPTLLAPIDGSRPVVGVEAARARLAERLGVFNDSIMAEAALAERNGDWTRTDAEGNKWGISRGKIHLGKITIPLNNNGEDFFRPAAGRREEIAAQARMWKEIEIMARNQDGKDSFEERVKEIRKRKEAERAARTKPITDRL